MASNVQVPASVQADITARLKQRCKEGPAPSAAAIEDRKQGVRSMVGIALLLIIVGEVAYLSSRYSAEVRQQMEDRMPLE